MQRAAQITALVVLLLSSCAVALQDTNLKVDWNALNSTGEVKFFGSAVIDGTTLNLTRDGVYNSSSSALLIVPVDVTRNFDLTLEISMASLMGSCGSAGEGIAFGFTTATQLTPLDGLNLGLDTTKKFWAASLDAVGSAPTVQDGSSGPDSTQSIDRPPPALFLTRQFGFPPQDWHVSFISGDGATAQWTANFYDPTNLVCANLLNAQSKMRLVYLDGKMFVFINNVLLGNETVNISSIVGASNARFFVSASSGISTSMDIQANLLTYRQFIINGDFSTALAASDPLDWNVKSYLQPPGAVLGTSCPPTPFIVASSSISLCALAPAVTVASGGALLGVAEGASDPNSFSSAQTLTFPIGQLSLVAFSYTPYALGPSTSPARTLEVFFNDTAIGYYAVPSPKSGQQELVTSSYRGSATNVSTADLLILSTFSDGYNGPATVGIDDITIYACSVGESLHPVSRRCIDCSAGATSQGLCDCGNNYYVSYNSTTATCNYCGDGSAALSSSTSCQTCTGNQIQTPAGVCASCAGVGIANNTTHMACVCPSGYSGTVTTTVDNCVAVPAVAPPTTTPVSSPTTSPTPLAAPKAAPSGAVPVVPPQAAPAASPSSTPTAVPAVSVAPIQSPSIAPEQPPSIHLTPVSEPITPPVAAPAAAVPERNLEITVQSRLNSTEEDLLKQVVANFTGLTVADFESYGNASAASYRRSALAVYLFGIRFVGSSIVAAFDAVFSSSPANATADLQTLLVASLPDKQLVVAVPQLSAPPSFQPEKAPEVVQRLAPWNSAPIATSPNNSPNADAVTFTAGKIAGIVVGSVLGAILLIVLVSLACSRPRKNGQETVAASLPSSSVTLQDMRRDAPPSRNGDDSSTRSHSSSRSHTRSSSRSDARSSGSQSRSSSRSRSRSPSRSSNRSPSGSRSGSRSDSRSDSRSRSNSRSDSGSRSPSRSNSGSRSESRTRSGSQSQSSRNSSYSSHTSVSHSGSHSSSRSPSRSNSDSQRESSSDGDELPDWDRSRD